MVTQTATKNKRFVTPNSECSPPLLALLVCSDKPFATKSVVEYTPKRRGYSWSHVNGGVLGTTTSPWQ